MYDLLILGSGPAGLGAAIYGMRAGLELAVVDRSSISGGQVLTTYEVDNYLGFSGISGSENIFVPHTDKEDLEAKAVILATGAAHSMLGVPGELELAGRGVSYCATCDGAFFRKRTVAVVGGGDVAVEDAIFLAAICKKVYLIHRRDALRAADSLQKKLMSLENIEILWNSEVKEIQGQDMVDHILL